MQKPMIEIIKNAVMSKKRHINDVVIQLVALIPETETDLINKINNYDKELWNQAPELRNEQIFWVALAHTLQENIPHIDTPWKEQMLKIFNETV
jgi:hypothetical protein